MQASEQTKERLLGTLTEVGGRLKVRNAMTPLLWLCGLITPACVCLMLWGNSVASVFAAVILAVVVASALGAYFYFLFKAPDRLQSEEYQIRSRMFDLVEEKGSTRAINANILPAVSDPSFVRLEGKPEEAKK